MSYKFQSVLHSTEWQAHMHIAAEWMSAGGMNDKEAILEVFEDYTDEAIAAECEKEWGLTEIIDGEPAVDYYSRDKLVKAVGECRKNPEDCFLCWDDE